MFIICVVLYQSVLSLEISGEINAVFQKTTQRQPKLFTSAITLDHDDNHLRKCP